MRCCPHWAGVRRTPGSRWMRRIRRAGTCGFRRMRGCLLSSIADEALGTDVFDHLPQACADDAGVGRQWRSLMNDVQVTCTTTMNAQRVATGMPPINSLWFWGAGSYPAQVATAHAARAHR